MSSARISPTAHYTCEVWVQNGMSDPAFATKEGARLHKMLWPLNAASRAFGRTGLLMAASLPGLVLEDKRGSGIDRPEGVWHTRCTPGFRGLDPQEETDMAKVVTIRKAEPKTVLADDVRDRIERVLTMLDEVENWTASGTKRDLVLVEGLLSGVRSELREFSESLS